MQYGVSLARVWSEIVLFLHFFAQKVTFFDKKSQGTTSEPQKSQKSDFEKPLSLWGSILSGGVHICISPWVAKRVHLFRSGLSLCFQMHGQPRGNP